MSTSPTPDTSVIFSLAELAALEEERVRDEAEARAARERERERARQAALEGERRAEAARIAGEHERRAERKRREEEARAREEARKQAAMDVARIEAEARARLEAEDAMRAHELQVLRVRNDARVTRLRHALGALLGLVLLAGGTAGWAVRDQVAQLRGELQHLRDDRWELERAHAEMLSSELKSLDDRHAALAEETSDRATEKARLDAEAARSAIEAGGLDMPRLRAFEERVARLSAAVTRRRERDALDRRLDDLRQWARASRNAAAAASALGAAAAARTAEGAALERYRAALDDLAARLSAGGRGAPRPTSSGAPPRTGGTPCSDPHDPMCGPDGMLLDTR